MTIIRQGVSFLAVGIGLIVVDWLVFVLLTAVGTTSVVANVAGRVTGAVLGFWLNGRVTFAQAGVGKVSVRRFVRYALLWSLLTLVSTALVALCAGHFGLRLAWLAKPLVEAGLALVSFMVSRHWVYR
ncbi:MAG TPA: GtrA family protein [Rhodanobacter sp.]|nr:GtrA family protein [Rhodanobacter sp.]